MSGIILSLAQRRKEGWKEEGKCYTLLELLTFDLHAMGSEESEAGRNLLKRSFRSFLLAINYLEVFPNWRAILEATYISLHFDLSIDISVYRKHNV